MLSFLVLHRLCRDYGSVINIYMETRAIGKIHSTVTLSEVRVKYCLYARKSTESDEMQALSIDSQIKEMEAIAERLNLNVIEVKKESHSAKASGERPVYKKLLQEIDQGKLCGWDQ